MNVTHAKEENPTVGQGDMLLSIFGFQSILRKRFREVEKKNGIYCPDILNIDAPKDQEHLKSMIYRIVVELAEATDCLKNKPWKQTHVHTDVEHFKEELLDATHFLVELFIEIGMSPQEVYQYYCKKKNVNEFRIDTKY